MKLAFDCVIFIVPLVDIALCHYYISDLSFTYFLIILHDIIDIIDIIKYMYYVSGLRVLQQHIYTRIECNILSKYKTQDYIL